MTVVLGSGREWGFHQQGGPKEIPEGRQLQELMGMVVETRGRGYHMESMGHRGLTTYTLP